MYVCACAHVFSAHGWALHVLFISLTSDSQCRLALISHCSSDVDEDDLKKVFEESGTVVKFKYFEYVINICDSYIAHTHARALNGNNPV